MARFINKGFTLIELLVVISIIGLLAAAGLAVFKSAMERGRVAQGISHAREIRDMALRYKIDTGIWPPDYRLTTVLNPFTTDTGVAGWNGPYASNWQAAHTWRGHIGWLTYDLDGNGDKEGAVVFDDDAPGTDSSDNTGAIPLSSMILIDKTLDDGVLGTGFVRGNGLGFGAAVGEIVIWYGEN